MGNLSIIAMSGTKRDLQQAAQFPPDVKWDKVVLVEIPDDHGEFPTTSGYTRKDFVNFESVSEDSQLYGYMKKCIDVVDDFLTKNDNQTLIPTMVGMNEGGSVFILAGLFLPPDHPLVKSYEPMLKNIAETLAIKF